MVKSIVPEISFPDVSHAKIRWIIPVEEVNRRMAKVERNFAHQMPVNGFRIGRVPRKLLWQKHKKVFQQHFAKDLVLDLWEGLFSHGDRPFVPVDRPRFDAIHLDHLDPFNSDPLEVTAEVDIVPRLGLVRKDYFGLTVHVSAPMKIDEKMVDAWIEERRHYWVTFRQAPEGRPAAEGDYLLIKWRERPKGEEKWRESLQMGLYLMDENGGRAPGFDEALLGIRMGDTRSFDMRALNDSIVEIEILGVEDHKIRVLPEIEEVVAYEKKSDLEELRQAVRQQLEKQAELEYQNNFRRAIMSKIIKYSFALPRRLVEEKTAYIMKVEHLRAMQAGTRFDDSPQNRFALQQIAEQALREDIVLDEIAQKEEIIVMNEEIENEIRRIACEEDESVDAVRERIIRAQAMPHLERQVLRQKTVSWLMENSKIVEEVII